VGLDRRPRLAPEMRGSDPGTLQCRLRQEQTFRLEVAPTAAYIASRIFSRVSPMLERAFQAPPARLALVFHAPTIARVELVPRRAAGRLARALLAWAVCWGALPLLVWVPPHYPWVLAAFAAGIYLPFRFWTGRYEVVSFSGFCPRCGRALELKRGSKISLPHALTCFGCHFEPVLEVSMATKRRATAPPPEPVRIEHRTPECAGEWRLERGRWPAALGCSECGARHCATPAARRAADEENQRGELLDELTQQGRFLL
jgi:hypothetical protein